MASQLSVVPYCGHTVRCLLPTAIEQGQRKYEADILSVLGPLHNDLSHSQVDGQLGYAAVVLVDCYFSWPYNTVKSTKPFDYLTKSSSHRC